MIERGELKRAVEALSRIFDEARGIDHSGAILEAGIYYAMLWHGSVPRKAGLCT